MRIGLPQTLIECQREQSLVSACRGPQNGPSFYTVYSFSPGSECRDRDIHSFKAIYGADACSISFSIGRPERVNKAGHYWVQSNQTRTRDFMSIWSGKFCEHAVRSLCWPD